MLTVSIANCIRFRPIDGEVSNFDNTFDQEFTAHDRLINTQFQQRYPSGLVTIQAVTAKDEVVECRAWYNDEYVPIVASPVVNLLNYDYTEFVIDFDTVFLTGVVIFELFTSEELWRSEPVMVEPTDDNFIILEWFNTELAFTMNYKTGIVPKMHLFASMNMAPPVGEATIYSNQGDETKLKELVQRVFTLTTFVPAHVAEQIAVAMAHDHFFINDVEFVSQKKPTPERVGNSNIYKLTVDLDQKIVLGLNTHDRGFDVDTVTDAILTEDGLYFLATLNNEYFAQ